MQPGAAQQSRNRYDIRQATLHKELYDAMQDKRLKQAIGDMDPVTVNGQGPGRRAWIYLESECAEEMTDLVIRAIKTKFDLAEMRSSVGFDVSTITDFNRHLNSIAGSSCKGERST